MKSKIMKQLCVVVGMFVVCSVAGTLRDSRDGKTYKTVEIGEQVWMAENLNYKTSGSVCYDNDSANCKKYGRLYTWEAAKKVCPAGWHLPNSDEWSSLWDAVGGVGSDGSGTKLMSKNGWDDGNGSDSFGFAVLPAGGRFGSQDFLGEGVGTQFWMFHAGFEIFWVIMKDGKVFRSSSNNGSNNAWSVRCLQDPNEGDKASLRKASLSENEEKKSSIGTLKDSRDGKTYKTVKIGEQVWMAENLNVNVPGSMCYDNNPANCNKYGRLYTWAAAMDSAGMVDLKGVGKGCGFGKECRVASEVSKVLVRGVCPEGWHLPRHGEWEALRGNVDVAVGNKVQITSTAGKELKSKSGWISGADGSSGNGSDSFGFAVLPAGYFENYDGRFVLQSSMAVFWSSEEGGRDHAHGWMFNIFKTFGSNQYSKGYAFSVRCLQDN